MCINGVQEMEVMDEGSESGKPKRKTATKQAHRKTFYVACQEAGLGSLAAKYGLTPEQFGENLRDNYQRHETEQHTVEPEEVAQDYVQPSGSAISRLRTLVHVYTMLVYTYMHMFAFVQKSVHFYCVEDKVAFLNCAHVTCMYSYRSVCGVCTCE